MEHTYTHTIKTVNGEEKELTLHRMTMRHSLKIAKMQADQAEEYLLDILAPGLLDMSDIPIDVVEEVISVIMEKEKAFFGQKTKKKNKKK